MTKLEKARAKAAEAMAAYRASFSEEAHRTLIAADNAVLKLEHAAARKADPKAARERAEQWEDAMQADFNGLMPSAARVVVNKLTGEAA